MNDSLSHTREVCEISLSIGNSLDMKQMLQESLGAYLRQLELAACAVLQKKIVEGQTQWDPVYAVPHQDNPEDILQNIIAKVLPSADRERELEQRPLSGRHVGIYYHIMVLPDFGLLYLGKKVAPLDENQLRWLKRLNEKLAIACRFCLQKGDNRKIAANLERENMTRNRAETALNESHERLLTVLNSIDVLIFASDLETHKMIFINRRMETLFGKNVMEKSCFEFYRGESAPCTHCTNDALLDPNGQPTGDIVWEDRNPITRKWYIHQARAIKWLDGRWVRLQISTDITRLKELEQERIKEAHLQQTQRLEALGILAGGVAHEYNNLLMSMLGNLSLINFKIDITHPFHRYLKKIEESIRLAAYLTDQLLGYAQKGRYENM